MRGSLAVIGLLIALGGAAAQEPAREAPIAWRSGAALETALRTPISARWSRAPLLEVLDDLAKRNRVCVLCDRRLDPGALVELEARDEPLLAVLERIAKSREAAAVTLQVCVYLGPESTAAGLEMRLAQLRLQVKELPPEDRKAWLRAARMRWSELSTPQEVIEPLEREAGWKLANRDLLPHDLLGARELPSLPLVDRLQLLLAQFDLSFEFIAAKRELRLVEWPNDLPRTLAEMAKSQDSRKGPGSRRTTATRKRTEVGPLKVASFRYTETPLREVLEVLARDFGLQLDLSRLEDSERAALASRVSGEHRDSTLEEVLAKLLEPHGWRATREGKELRIEVTE